MSTSKAVPSLESTYFSGASLQPYPRLPPDYPENDWGAYAEARSVPIPPRTANVSIILDKRLLYSTRRISHVWTAHVHNPLPNATYPSTVVAKIYDPIYFDSGEAEYFDPFSFLDLYVSKETQAYQRLQRLYGTKVPRFYGHFVAPLPTQHDRTVNVVLLEYIHGRDIRDLVPREREDALCSTHNHALIDAALRLYFDVLALGVEQNDMQPRNVILRPRRQDGPFCSTEGCPLLDEADCKYMQMAMVDFEVVEFREPDGQFSDPVSQASYIDKVKSLYHEGWLKDMI
ncbi:uncharacterized protein ARMOST_18062 [Armillaria ostoyae]|uniref:Protein kinase domain-containing protein n=1 Tax=Armillaria ostoyae TaxID=47428 RepID=A0A284S0R4_ARMOS|nr:uncharacterized protein ARMOST_18062 [Armillaria ostoyae]